MMFRSFHEFLFDILVGGGVSEGCSSQSDPLVGSVEDGVESFEESLAKDEVQSGSTLATNVTNNQVNLAFNTTNGRVKFTRPDLSIGSQLESGLIERVKRHSVMPFRKIMIIEYVRHQF